MERPIYFELIQKYLRIFPVCAILGARQVGKTTLARQVAQAQAKKVKIFDLEHPQDLLSLENPMTTLEQYHDYLIIIDEIQRKPDLFTVLRVLCDDPVRKFQFLILGSASQDLIKQSAESLAGRIGYINLPPFTLFEVMPLDVTIQYAYHPLVEKNTAICNQLLVRGGFPRSYLAQSQEDSFVWRKEYIDTFLERDLPSLGFSVAPEMMYRFWMMLCFYHAQVCNTKEIAKSLMVSDKMVNHYLDILVGTFMVRVLQPWHENIKKRQIKAPKIYIKDSGVFNYLLSIHSMQELVISPKVGPLWEGFALEQVINCFQIPQRDCYFWSTHNDAELDLLVFLNGKKIGFEFKFGDGPKLTKSMHIAVQDLQLDALYVIYPGNMKFVMQDKITACGLQMIGDLKL